MKNIILYATLLLSVLLGNGPLTGQTIILSENFETVPFGVTPPAGWTRSQATPSYGFEFGSSILISSQYFSIPPHSNFACSNDDRHDDQSKLKNIASEDRLITPPLDLTPFAGNEVNIIFDILNPGQYGSSGSLEVSTDSGNTWSTLANFLPQTTWVTEVHRLSAYTSFDHVLVAFRHNDGGEWATGIAVDNVIVKSVPELEVELSSLKLKQQYLQEGIYRIEGSFVNRGSDPISSIELGYSVDGGPVKLDSITGLNLTSGSAYNFSHSERSFFPIGIHNLAVFISNPNGNGVDSIPATDTITHRFSVLSSIPVKKVVLQDFTGAWCQFCPDGTVVMNNLLNTNPNVIGVATHEGDSMEIPDGVTMMNEVGISAFPAGGVDLVKFEDQFGVAMPRGAWEAKVNERASQIVPVSVSVSYNEYDAATRTIAAVVRADFVGEFVEQFPPDLRLNLWVLEDSVTGIGRGYDQVNAFNNQSGHPYFAKGNPIVGFVHDHTLRAMVGGPWGSVNSVPGPIANGYWVRKTFTYVLPPHIDEKHVKLVGLLQQYDGNPENRPILNADEVALDLNVGVEHINAENRINLYPNPFSDQVSIEFELPRQTEVTVAIYDITGKQVTRLTSASVTGERHRYTWDGLNAEGVRVAGGIYSVHIHTPEQTMTGKLVMKR